jgi:hypothetical protein
VSPAERRKRERERLRVKRANPVYLAAERKRQAERMRAKREKQRSDKLACDASMA